jgi:TrmH family RNA methyltransferase
LPTVKRVTSRRNAIVERYRAVARGDEAGLLLDGPHLVSDAVAAKVRIVSAIVASASEARPDVAASVAALTRRRVEILSASPAVMAAVSPVRSSSAIVALAEPRALPVDAPYAARLPLVVIACDVQDPGNLGAIVRVAEAGGASGVVAAGACANPFGWKALRGSMGSALRLPVVAQPRIDQAIAQARTRGCRVIATAPRDGQSLFRADLKGPLAVLVGSEGAGLPADVANAADERVSIPMAPPVESLNTAVTAALVVYEATRQRQ